jgi:phospholipase C
VFDFDKKSLTDGSDFVVAGFLRNADGLYMSARTTPQLNANNPFYFAAKRLRRWTPPIDDDEAERVDLEMPYGVGLTGSPNFSELKATVPLTEQRLAGSPNIVDPIRHVVSLALENHSFDQMLDCFKGTGGRPTR